MAPGNLNTFKAFHVLHVSHTLHSMSDDFHNFTERASAFLKILAGRTRCMLICELLDGEKSVNELAMAIRSRTTAVSQQLAILRTSGMVSTRREGQKVFYSLKSEEARRFVAALLEVLEQNANAAFVEQAHMRAA